MMYRKATALALTLTAAACGDDSTGPVTQCDTVPLPYATNALAPSVRDVVLEVQGTGIVLHATATDPQGSANLLDVEQTIGVYRNRECTGSLILLSDDLAGSGVEESFGTVVTSSVDGSLFQAISAATSWPVTVDFRNLEGNRTVGTVMARVDRN